jgi:hypothetical protein
VPVVTLSEVKLVGLSITGDLATGKISSNGPVSVEGKGELW